MKIAELIRLEESNFGTLGILKIDKQVFCCTLEPPDRENKIDVSSIPTGQYICKRYSSSKYRDTFQITDVPGRTFVLFHAGNHTGDTAGCVLLGQYFGKLKYHDRAVLNSGDTFKRFMNHMKPPRFLPLSKRGFHLTITEVY
jgi:hypothetical protein